MNTLGDDKCVSLNANLFIALFAVNKHMPFEWSASICGGLNDFNSLVSTFKNFIVDPHAYNSTELFMKNAFCPLYALVHLLIARN